MATTTSTTGHDRDTATTVRPRSALYTALVGLTSLAIVLQGLWAGLFVKEGEDYTATWVQVHATGGEVAIALSLVATIVALVRLRSRKDLVVGTSVLTVVLVLEAYIGGIIGGHANLTAVHFPLAMILVALAVWLPMRAVRR